MEVEYYIMQHPDLVFPFFTFPIFGWLLYETINKKVIKYALFVSCILLIPAITTDYSYVIDNAYPVLLYLILAFGQYFLLTFFKSRPVRILSIIIPSCLMFFYFGYYSFLGVMAGSISVEQQWKVKNYKIYYIKDQGFSGRALMKYELYQYAPIPIFIKHVDTKVDDDTTNNCVVHFKDENFSFNKCLNK